MSRQTRWTTPWLLALLVLTGLAAAPPEIVRLRVPTSGLARWFPPGTEVKAMTAAEFEALAAAAARGARSRAVELAPRLVRARHRARWVDGLLIGRSELTLAPGAPGSARTLRLDPWTPAVDATAEGTTPVWSDDTGQTLLRLNAHDPAGPPSAEPAPMNAVIAWELRAREGTRGRKFTLGLPAIEPSELVLDVPVGLEPEGLAGLRLGPDRKDGRARWVIAGPVGRAELALVDGDGKADTPGDPGLWLEGPTRIDVEEAAATWRLDASVSAGPGAPARLILALDPGLDLVGVDGPAVDDVQAQPGDDGSTRLTIRLRGPLGKTPTRIAVRALASVPSQGRWIVPAARPVNAVWTGGTTTVHVGPSRVIESVDPLSGHRLASPTPSGVTAGLGDDHRLDFAAERPVAVAALVFRKPHADVSAEIRGLLQVGNTAPRLSCRLAWTFHRGRPHDLEIDLPRAWTADRIEIEGRDEPVSWHADTVPEGGSRVRVIAPSGDFAERALVLNLSATSSVAGGRGPLALPRVRPTGAAIADEVWVARLEAGMALRPTLAHGLAWLDPQSLEREPATADGTRAALAWRWTAVDGEARVERERTEPAPRGSIDLIAEVMPDRLRLDARLSIAARDEPVRSFTIGLTEPVPDSTAWRFFDETTSQELPHKPLGPRARAQAGDLGRGPAWQIDLPHPQRGGRIALRAHYEGRWPGRGALPLVVMPPALRARGTLLIVTGRDVRTTASPTLARGLDPVVTAEALAGDGETPGEAGGSAAAISPRRHAHAFLYESPGARIDLTAEALAPADAGGLIREASLSTLIDPQGGSPRNRLVLRVVPDGATALEVALPEGSMAERVLRDGQPLTPTTLPDQSLSIPLRVASPSRPLVVVTIDYRNRSAATTATVPTRISPGRPTFSMPCLSLAWDLIVPDAWEVSDWGKALTPADPSLQSSGGFDRLTRWRRRVGPVWGSGWPRSPRHDRESEAGLRDFRARLAAARTEETSLGDWLIRLDAGRQPIVIDRLALAAAGWGPRSRVVPPRSASSPAGDPLEGLGLAVVPLGSTLLITTAARAPASTAARDDWSLALRQAGAWGSDSADRFQSVGRWRDEAMPRSAGSDLSDPTGVEPGRAVWRFQATGWPAAGVEVHLVDRRRQDAATWTVALGVLSLGLAVRRRWPAAAVALNVAVFGLGLEAAAWVPGWLGGAADGLVVGAGALAILRLGALLPGPRRLARRDARSTVTYPRRGGPDLATPALLALGALAAATPWALCQDASTTASASPVLVLFPYDGPADPSRPPDRALIRLADDERLRRLAEPSARAPGTRLDVVAARHRVRRRGDRRETVEVETELTLRADGSGQGTAIWTFPIDAARDISARLDEQSVPVRIEPGARAASVAVVVDRPDQTVRLTIRRVVNARRGDWGESIAVTVNPVATAQIEVEGHPDGLRAVVPGALGRMIDRGEAEGPVGRLGPISTVEVRWVAPGGEDARPSAGAVDGLYLWDTTPAGDLIRARLTYHDPRGTGLVRLALGRGVLVRDVSIAGAVDVSREGTLDHPEWVARIEPPLADGATIALEVFRPRSASTVAPGVRSAPRIEPIGVERSRGVLALRRPADWSGRLTPAPAEGTEAFGEEAFVRAWGDSLPDDPLTLSGAVTLAATPTREARPEVTIATGPGLPRLRIESTERLTIVAGRIDVVLDAELTETSGPVDEVELVRPDGFRPVRVSAEGLTDWTLASNRLRLRFDGPTLHRRRVHVDGWIAVDADPLAPALSVRDREVAVPWMRWPGHDEQPGTLIVVAPTQASLVRSASVTLMSSDAGPPARLTYRVNPADELGRLRWEGEPPRVAVRLQSQLTLDPTSAEWLAVMRYDVSDGPLDAIMLKLPADWARGASAWLDGVRCVPKAETRREATYWTIRPDRPVWGTQRLVIQATLPFPPGESRSFPDLSPLGWGGEVDTSLRVINATRQPISIERQPGLQPMASQSFAGHDELAETTPRAVSVASYCYHVVRSGWSLRVQKPTGTTHGKGVAHGEIACTLAADGSVLGFGRYELGPRSGPFLGLELPAGSVPLWASVNGTPARPLNAAPRRWQIPLAEDSISRLAVIWRSLPPRSQVQARSEPAAIPLPIVGQETEPVPVVVTVYTQAGVRVFSPSGRLTACGTDRVELDQAQWLVDETTRALSNLDRSSRRDAENLVAALMRIELLFRMASRASAFERTLPQSQTTLPSPAELIIPRLRGPLKSAVQAEALDEFEVAARVHLGLASDPVAGLTAPSPESPPPAQVRPIGLPQSFQGVVDAATPTPWLAWVPPRASVASADPVGAWTLGGFTLLMVLLAAVGHKQRLGRLALAAGLVGVVIWAGPVWLAAAAGLAILGRIAQV